MSISPFVSFVSRAFTSVKFGVLWMVLIAVYLAVGSGCRPVREALEMDEAQFFNAWPLKVLMALLVVNLATVTWRRIPFTPPRYGVWCIHAGIVVLVAGASFYYHFKQEGRTLLPVKDGPADAWARYFYDHSERCLYAKADGEREVLVRPLPSLPRFGTYLPAKEGEVGWRRGGLEGMQDFIAIDPDSVTETPRTLSQALGTAADVKVDVLGYWPYADITTRFVTDTGSDATAVALAIPSGPRETWVSDADERTRRATLGDTEFEHASTDEITSELTSRLARAVRVHRLAVSAGGAEPRVVDAELGGTEAVGEGGYLLTPIDFNPAWPLSGTGRRVGALALRVVPPGGRPAFNRVVLDGVAEATDFKPDGAGGDAGSLGARQAELIDPSLRVSYTLHDELRLTRGGVSTVVRLMPVPSRLKHTLISTGDDGLVDVGMAPGRPAKIQPLPRGRGELIAEAGGVSVRVGVERHDHMRATDDVTAVPVARRVKEDAEAGTHAVVLARVSAGGWAREVALPFVEYPLPPVGAWSGPGVRVPGVKGLVRLEFGRTPRPLPVDLALDRFEVVHYPGGRDGTAGVVRDLKSTIRLRDRRSGAESVAVAGLNAPVYLAGGSWLVYQHAWDPDGQRWAVVGVGTRPGVGAMLAGCVMVVAGLLYAFYAKPVVVRRMKRRALGRVVAKGAAVEAAVAG